VQKGGTTTKVAIKAPVLPKTALPLPPRTALLLPELELLLRTTLLLPELLLRTTLLLPELLPRTTPLLRMPPFSPTTAQETTTAMPKLP